MKEWIFGSAFLLAVLGVLYVYGLPIAGSLWRRYRFARARWRMLRQVARIFSVPPRVLK
jgi:hypothetical protein